ncbi:MAG: hypothetical protein ACLUVC_06915 [Longibaculum sp.]
MGFIENLNKYGYKVAIHKTDIYQKIEEARLPLEAMGLKVKIKNEFDLFDYEIIYRGMLTQNRIENTYEMFLNEHYDLLDYLNYDEKQKMFNNDIAPILEEAPHFYDETSQTEIYIPYLEPFVNKRYTKDYQILLLKQHRDYIKNYQVTKGHPIQLYSKHIFRTPFTSLQNVFEDERHICLYYDELKTIYIFKKESNELLNKVIFVDHEYNGNIDIEIVKTIAYDIENYLYKDCLDLLKENDFITNKTYQKVLKKYK